MNSNSFIGPMTDSIVNGFVDEMKKKKNRDKIMENIIEPILNDIRDRYLPCVMGFAVLVIMVIILLVLLLISNSKCCNNCQLQQK